MDEVATVDGLVRYVCAFCNNPTDDEPRYALLTVKWAFSEASQGLGAHTSCLRAAVHPSIPLAIE
jgi:hypothetical protein